MSSLAMLSFSGSVQSRFSPDRSLQQGGQGRGRLGGGGCKVVAKQEAA